MLNTFYMQQNIFDLFRHSFFSVIIVYICLEAINSSLNWLHHSALSFHCPCCHPHPVPEIQSHTQQSFFGFKLRDQWLADEIHNMKKTVHATGITANAGTRSASLSTVALHHYWMCCHMLPQGSVHTLSINLNLSSIIANMLTSWHRMWDYIHFSNGTLFDPVHHLPLPPQWNLMAMVSPCAQNGHKMPHMLAG